MDCDHLDDLHVTVRIILKTALGDDGDTHRGGGILITTNF